MSFTVSLKPLKFPTGPIFALIPGPEFERQAIVAPNEVTKSTPVKAITAVINTKLNTYATKNTNTELATY